MKRAMKIIITIIIVIIIIAIIVFAYVKNNSRQDTKESEPVTVGVIVSLSGDYANIGESMREGAKLAQEEINILTSSPKLNLLFEDGQADAKVGLGAYRKLADINGVKFFLLAHSNISQAVSAVAQKEGNLALSIYSSAVNLTAIGDLVFRNEVRIEGETQKLVDYVLGKNYRKAAILPVNTEGSMASAKLFQQKFEAKGGQITLIEKYGAKENDFRTQLTKIKSSNPDVIFAIGGPKQMGEIIKQAHKLGIGTPLVSDFHAEGPELLSVAGSSADGLVYSHTLDLTSLDPAVKNYADKFRAKYRQEPDYFSAAAYDSINIIYNSARNCAPINDLDCVRKNLLSVENYPGVTGKTTIDSSRETDKTIILKIVKNGQFVPLEQN